MTNAGVIFAKHSKQKVKNGVVRPSAVRLRYEEGGSYHRRTF